MGKIGKMECFIEDGVYIRVGDNTHLYVCSVKHGVAKLIEYKLMDDGYGLTGNQYFLNFYRSTEADFKSYITNPANYEQAGRLKVNFSLDAGKLCPLLEKT